MRIHILTRSRSRSVQNAAVHKAREIPGLSAGVLQRTALRTCCANDTPAPPLVLEKIEVSLKCQQGSGDICSVSLEKIKLALSKFVVRFIEAIWNKMVLPGIYIVWMTRKTRQFPDKETAIKERRTNMSDKMIENNQVSIVGEIMSPFTFSHEVFGEGFYMADIAVKRLSDSEDLIPVMVSERLVDVTEDLTGITVRVAGQFRSYNRHEEKKNKLVLSVFAREWEYIDEEVENAKTNQIFLDGFICKPPVYRKTPLGREIADLLIAVNRPYGKSDYIPCICWGRNARFASGFEVGGRTQVWGRIQSREYMKKLDEIESEKRVAYEVSVSKLEYV